MDWRMNSTPSPCGDVRSIWACYITAVATSTAHCARTLGPPLDKCGGMLAQPGLQPTARSWRVSHHL